ncbi:MAG: DUF4422 domain-containing protein [Erysipelotrichaceae bacterium]|nr:DUF4422 domain-containing protein [Erysipelotrichaceae bacterium]
MEIKVIVAAHKEYPMPQDPMYLPLQVGAAGKESIGWQRDDAGEQISEKNPTYCELTGLYWAWKNLDCTHLGIVHYRRHFKGSAVPFGVLSQKEAERLLQKADCIVPVRQRYFIETIYSHYQHTHYEQDLIKTRRILEKRFPEYLEAFDHHMQERSGHMFNMFVMKKELADEWCKFIFSVLSDLEQETDLSGYDEYQARVFGRISEILLDVWLQHRCISCIEADMVYTEKINWLKKGSAFLKAKFFHKRYKGSF